MRICTFSRAYTYTCTHTHIYIYIYIYTHTHISIYIHIYAQTYADICICNIHIHTYSYTYTYTYVTCTGTYTFTYTYPYTYTCMCTCMYVYTHIYIYICIERKTYACIHDYRQAGRQTNTCIQFMQLSTKCRVLHVQSSSRLGGVVSPNGPYFSMTCGAAREVVDDLIVSGSWSFDDQLILLGFWCQLWRLIGPSKPCNLQPTSLSRNTRSGFLPALIILI